MAKKPNSESSFGQNPFKQLKGFAVSPSNSPDKDQKNPAPKPVKVNDPQARTAPGGAEAEPSFVEEMARLGVVSSSEPEAAPEPEPEPLVTPVKAPPAAGPLTEEQLFIRALGRLDASFQDDYELETAPPEASPRRMKQLRQGVLQPEGRLDLHGLTREEARSRVRFFLEDASYQQKKVVLIITGWGKNSAGEPVLRQEIERYLSLDAKAWVVEWGRAPRQLGGDGALVVFLKGC
jgi:DNA-nicking Smr family endonuclease